VEFRADLAIQCSICVFDGLLPEPYNKPVLKLLFIFARWHALAKLRLHTEPSVDLLGSTTELLGKELRTFEEKTCPAFDTQELKREAEARQRRQAKNPSMGPTPRATTAGSTMDAEMLTTSPFSSESSLLNSTEVAAVKPFNSTPEAFTAAAASLPPHKISTSSTSTPGMSSASSASLPSAVLSSGNSAKKRKIKTSFKRLVGPRKKTFNRRTYKNHSLGDCVKMIRMYGTTDSYSTEGVGSSIFLIRGPILTDLNSLS